ncbi:ABC transporter permease [Globicatella sulfidifaciens]|uniref:Transport permease protein n=1 Tax=Globicatella sulfidifaciens TaxID=136093 RepID=A0A7X8C5I5_9LACT|nr:ABC transporter permease [Globicatella sulfidifaciens]NLJ19267.1 ABC transporter permease [Globicatella sulfidifaciens]
MKKYIKEMLKRKDLIGYLVLSGQKANNRDSYLGYFWWLLDPLLNVLIFYFLRVVILKATGEDLAVFLAIGLVVWKWMSSTINSSSKSITRHSSIINQVYLPKAIFPIATTLSQMFNFAFGLIVIAIFLAIFGVIPGWQVIFLPVIILVQLIFLLAVSLFIGYISVFIRDIDNLTKHIVRLLFYASPVIWEGGRLAGSKYEFVVRLNPFAFIIDAYRDVLMYGQTPSFLKLGTVALGSLVAFILLIRHYSRNEHKIIKSL